MNTHDLIRHKGLLAIILGVAVIASAGGLSAVYADTGSNQTQTLKPKILGSIPLNNESLTKVTVIFAVAANTAATAPLLLEHNSSKSLFLFLFYYFR